MTSERLTIELDGTALERLDEHRREEGCSRSEAAHTLIEEGLRMAKHPGIVFRPGPAGRRASLAGGPDVWQVAYAFVHDDPPGEPAIAGAMEWTGLTRRRVLTALRYYLEYGDEVHEWIRRNDEEADQAYAEWLRKRKAAS